MQREVIDMVIVLAVACQQLDLVKVSVHQIHTQAIRVLVVFLYTDQNEQILLLPDQTTPVLVTPNMFSVCLEV